MPAQGFLDLVLISTRPGDTVTLLHFADTASFRTCQAALSIGRNVQAVLFSPNDKNFSVSLSEFVADNWLLRFVTS